MSDSDTPQESDGEAFTLSREFLAQLLAADASGFVDAVAEEDDFELADQLLKIINERYDD